MVLGNFAPGGEFTITGADTVEEHAVSAVTLPVTWPAQAGDALGRTVAGSGGSSNTQVERDDLYGGILSTVVGGVLVAGVIWALKANLGGS